MKENRFAWRHGDATNAMPDGALRRGIDAAAVELTAVRTELLGGIGSSGTCGGQLKRVSPRGAKYQGDASVFGVRLK